MDRALHRAQAFCQQAIGDIIFHEVFIDMISCSQRLLNKVGDSMKGNMYGLCS